MAEPLGSGLRGFCFGFAWRIASMTSRTKILIYEEKRKMFLKYLKRKRCV